jgi:hypothetical protein
MARRGEQCNVSRRLGCSRDRADCRKRADERLDDFGVEQHVAHDPGTQFRMFLDHLEFLGGQCVGLAQHVVADPNLTDVVQQRTQTKNIEIFRRNRQIANVVRTTSRGGGARLVRIAINVVRQAPRTRPSPSGPLRSSRKSGFHRFVRAMRSPDTFPPAHRQWKRCHRQMGSGSMGGRKP